MTAPRVRRSAALMIRLFQTSPARAPLPAAVRLPLLTPGMTHAGEGAGAENVEQRQLVIAFAAGRGRMARSR
jgi:hypothetical protein